MNDREAGGIQGTFDNFLKHNRNVWGILAWFHDCCITGCNGADERAQREIDGEVVGANNGSATACGDWERDQIQTSRQLVDLPYNEHASKRVLPNAWAHERVRERNVGRLLVLHPFRQFLAHENKIIGDPVYLDQAGFKGAFAQVQLVGFKKLGLMVFDAINIHVVSA